MPAELDAEMAALAVELINEYGGTATITYQNRNPVYDSATGTYSGGTVISPATPKAIIEDKGTWIDGQVKGEKKLTVAASASLVKPEAGDKFTVNGEEFTVMAKGVVTTYSGNTTVLYEIFGVSS